MSGVVVPDDDEVDVGRREPGALDRLPGGLSRQIRRRDARFDDVPLADAGALQDPFVARFDHLLEIGVGEHAWRNVGGQAGDARTALVRGEACYHSRVSLPGAVSPKYS